jgi:hypothetical protein
LRDASQDADLSLCEAGSHACDAQLEAKATREASCAL